MAKKVKFVDKKHSVLQSAFCYANGTLKLRNALPKNRRNISAHLSNNKAQGGVEMKKYIILALCVAVLIGAIWLIGAQTETRTATGYTVTAQKIDRTVRCDGIIEPVDTKTVFPPAYCVIDQVEVKTGDVVKKGDTLFTIDLELTQQVLVNSGKLSASAMALLEKSATVTAPIDGIVTAITLVKGAPAEVAKSYVILADTDTLQVTLNVPESAIKDVWIGQSAVVEGSAFAREFYKGTVTFLSAAANPQLAGVTAIGAVVSLDETDASLRLGLSAQVHLLAETFEKGLLVPYDCLGRDSNGDYVLTVENGKTAQRYVTVGAELPDGAVIVEGILENDVLVREAETFENGEAVTLL